MEKINPVLKPVVLGIAAVMSSVTFAEQEPLTIYITSNAVMTVPQTDTPLTVELDPKAPQQPIPASDGASFLKNVPGFSVVRKGGTDGDPVLRGLAGSRLPVLLDGMDFHGGCSSRMDPPTAYVFPESFDVVKVFKGPQTVAYGNGNSAGVVVFEHSMKALEPGVSGDASVMLGSFGRKDAVAGVQATGDQAYLKTALTHSESDNYKDGNGTEIHSKYERESATLIGGYRIDNDTNVELDYVVSRGEAAYADRSTDGSQFDRESYGAKLVKENISPLVKNVTARIYHSYIDHVMDNYSLRADPAAGQFSVMEVDRETDGFRLSADLALGVSDALKVGVDRRADGHGSWMAMMAQKTSEATANSALASASLTKDYQSQIHGLYGEWTHRLPSNAQLVSGLRADFWDADRFNSMPAFSGNNKETLKSGFIRWEKDLTDLSAKTYVGYGLSERPMDYWEATKYNGITANSSLDTEKTHQIDAGLLWNSSKAKGSISAFYAKVDDYILTYSGSSNSDRVANEAQVMGMGSYYGSGNVQATRYGAEVDVAYQLTPFMKLTGSAAYVHADNDTHDVPLAQTPPLEVKLGLDYTQGAWT